MTTPERNDTSPAPALDLRAHARRAWMLLGGSPRDERETRPDDDDDDDDLPRPNAIVALFLFPRLAARPMPA